MVLKMYFAGATNASSGGGGDVEIVDEVVELGGGAVGRDV
jgi:hypothetical protein